MAIAYPFSKLLYLFFKLLYLELNQYCCSLGPKVIY